MILGRFRMRGRDPDLAHARDLMLARDLKARDIHDPRVLEAMRAVPRELFVPPEMRADAYADRALPIGHGQTISQPYIVALMAQALALGGTESVLEIGVGSGYATAVLAQLANWVIGLERVPELAESASARFGALEIENVEVHVGDGRRGWPAGAPYDGVLVSAAAPEVPAELAAELAEGGRLVIPIGEESGTQMLTQIVRRGRKHETRMLCPCKFVPLLGGEAGAEMNGGARTRERGEAGEGDDEGEGPRPG